LLLENNNLDSRAWYELGRPDFDKTTGFDFDLFSNGMNHSYHLDLLVSLSWSWGTLKLEEKNTEWGQSPKIISNNSHIVINLKLELNQSCGVDALWSRKIKNRNRKIRNRKKV
jgi:hypothetical protein